VFAVQGNLQGEPRQRTALKAGKSM
jgi:hypothetical protein